MTRHLVETESRAKSAAAAGGVARPAAGGEEVLLRVQRDFGAALAGCGDADDCHRCLVEHALRVPGLWGCWVGGGFEGGALRIIASGGVEGAVALRLSGEACGGAGRREVEVDLIPAGLLVFPLGGGEELFFFGLLRGVEADPPLELILESMALQAGGALSLHRTRKDLEAKVVERGRRLREAQASLAGQAARLRYVLDATGAGFSCYEIGKDLFEWDGRLREIYGMDEDGEIRAAAVIERIHPEDRAMIRSMLEPVDAPGSRDVQDLEFRVIHPEAGERWIARRGIVERDTSGRAVRLLAISFDVTERRRADKEVLRAESRFRRLYEGMMDAFAVFDGEGRFVECNRVFEDLTGYGLDELRRMRPGEIRPEDSDAGDARTARMRLLRGQGHTDPYEDGFRRKDGTVVLVEARDFLVPGEIAGSPEHWMVVRDISWRKRAERAVLDWNRSLEKRVGERTAELMRSESRFRQLAEAIFDGLVITEHGVIRDGNERLAEMFGVPFQELVGRDFLDFVASEDRAMVVERAKLRQGAVYEFVGMRSDGSLFPVQVNSRRRKYEGREVHVSALRDLTQERLAASVTRELQTDLEQARRLALVSEVCAGIIHQISQPLCAMGGNLSAALGHLAQSTPRLEQVREAVADVDHDARRLREMVVRLRTLVKPGRAERGDFDMNSVVAGVLATLESERERSGVELERCFAEGLPQVNGDAVQFGQVVLNLVQNAFEACAGRPEGLRRVTVGTEPEGTDAATLVVTDTGGGIPGELMCRIFSPLFTTKSGGLGMGLRLSQTIVHAHGGSIGCRNRGDGAEFRASLPVHPSKGM
jgi:PAS domain S-box-containing protein